MRRPGAPARSPASTRSTCGSAASPRSRTCSAACSAPPSNTSSAPRWRPCRTATGSYYLPRIEGTSYEESLQDSSLAQLIRANTGIKHLPGNIFTTPEYTIEASDYYVKNADGTVELDANNNPTFLKNSDGTPNTTNWLQNPTTGALMVNVQAADGTLVFVGDNNFLGNEIVLGGTEGNDKLTAGPSDADTMWGDGGNDVIDGGGGADFLFGGDGNDTVIGGQGDDTMHGDAGNDTIYGGDGIDTIFGGDGNDYMEGGRGDDSMLGGLGNDIIIGNEGFDALIGNEGDDWLESRGGQGDLMFGDFGAPTGQQPLYSGNDVMVGGVAGGDIMKGFSGDDIMLGHGSFTKFIGGLGFDWGSYELATQGVDEDMNRKEFVAANGAVDNIRDVWQRTEGASGSAFDDIILGDNATKLLTTKDELDNVNLITGLAGFFDPGVVSFDGGNILLGGGGNDTLIGGGGNDIIDGDAWLHVGLTSYSAGGTIIRQILHRSERQHLPRNGAIPVHHQRERADRQLRCRHRPRQSAQRGHRGLPRHPGQLHMAPGSGIVDARGVPHDHADRADSGRRRQSARRARRERRHRSHPAHRAASVLR